MKRICLAAAMAAIPGLCLAASAADFLSRVPGLPANAMAAYALWKDSDGNLTPGAQYAGLESAMQAALTTQMPGQDPAAAQKAQGMAAHLNTPEGQAELNNMTMEQKMALARQMQANLGYGPPQMAAGPVSPQDGALARQVQPYSGTAQIMQKTQALRQSVIALKGQWDKDAAAIDAAGAAERNRLPVCRGEAGEPSGLAVKTVELKYADRKIALADSYLPRFNSIAAQFRQAVMPEVANGDAAAAAWAKLGSPALKSQLAPSAHAAQAAGINDAVGLLGLVEDVSKKAAMAVADRKRIERVYAEAKGC